MQEQTGIERVTDVVVIEVGTPSQRGSDQARAHRRPRRQPETQISDHRKTTEKIHQSEALRHGSTVGARATTAVETHGQDPGRSAGGLGGAVASGRTFAIEGAGGLGYLLAQPLVAAGDGVVDVQPKLVAGVATTGWADLQRGAGSWSWGPPAMR